MRNLTIKRNKSYAGCLAKMKIYIEDLTSNELTIQNTPCRKIGTLKNGEEKTFQIGQEAAKVFVIADKVSKDYCSEYYQLPEGQEDISLSGKNMLNPTAGNPFRFDNNESAEVITQRKRGSRKGLIIFIAAVLIGLVVGFLMTSGLLSAPKEKTFSSDGMTVTLTDEFHQAELGNFTVSFDSKNVAVFALEEQFTLADGMEDLTLERYADLVIQTNGLDVSQVVTEDGLTGFRYTFTNPQTKDTYHYFSYVYKTGDAFWLVQFATLDANVDKFAPQITQWAKSVTFSN